jgi:chromate transporter
MNSVVDLFFSFVKIGATSFGGGPPAIPMMQRELVAGGRLTDADFANGLALSNSLPGPIITNMAVYAGMKIGGPWVAAFAVFGAILPTFLIMLAGVWFFVEYHNSTYVSAAFKGIRPTVIALLAYTIYKLIPAGVTDVRQALIGAVFFVLVAFFKLHPALAIILSGMVGMALYVRT